MRHRLFLGAASAIVVLAGSSGSALAANPFPPNPSWQTNGTVRAITFYKNTMYVGGQFTAVRAPGAASGGKTRHNVAAFNATTGALLPWNPGANGAVRAIAVSSTRVYLGGSFTSVHGHARNHLAALTKTGAVARWNPGANAAVFAVRLGPNGKLFVGGDFSRIHGATRHRIASVGRSASAPVTGWAPVIGQVSGFACPPRCAPRVFTIAFSPNGQKVYFGGHFGIVNGASRNEIAAVPINAGRTVLPFNPNIYAAANCPTCTTVETSRVYHIISTPTRIYTCGGYWKVNGNKTSYNVSAFNPTSGVLLNSFTGQDDGDTPGCALRKGILYVGGHFNVAGPNCKPGNQGPCVTRHHVAAFDTRDNTLVGWNPGANSNHGLLAIANGGSRVGFGGYFTRIGGRNQQGIALYQAGRLP